MGDLLTARVALELVDHEAIVLEAYLDSENVWTWGIGVTDRSGHGVARYKNSPSTIQHVLEVYLWLLRKNYIPAVLRAFDGFPLTEEQFAAALSFHYNTGAIGTTSWVRMVKNGQLAAARNFLTTHYLNDGALQGRRDKEAALFFDGKWSQRGTATVLPINKSTYRPIFSKGKQVDIRADMDKALAV